MRLDRRVGFPLQLLVNVNDGVTGETLFVENHTFSNGGIAVSLVSLAAGVTCFLLPLKKNYYVVTILLAVLYWVLVVVLGLVEMMVTENLVGLIRPRASQSKKVGGH